jgi:hypothetical protein
MTAGGLFFVLNQDLGHGPGHDEDHHAEAHETHGKNKGQDEPNTDDDKTGDGATKSDDTADDKKDTAKDTAKPQQKEGKVDKPDDDSKPGAGRPDAGEEGGLQGHSSSESQKATDSGKASPDQSDKVIRYSISARPRDTDCRSRTRAESPRAQMRPQANRRVYLTLTPTILLKSHIRMTRARRVRVSPRPLSSRELCQVNDQLQRIKRSEGKLRVTRTRSDTWHFWRLFTYLLYFPGRDCCTSRYVYCITEQCQFLFLWTVMDSEINFDSNFPFQTLVSRPVYMDALHPDACTNQAPTYIRVPTQPTPWQSTRYISTFALLEGGSWQVHGWMDWTALPT